MKNKFLIIPNNLEDIENCRNVGITTFLLPVKDFSIGYNEFTIEQIKDIPDTKYLLVNRIFTSYEIDNLYSLVKTLDIKGVFFDDLGVFYKLKDLDIELIAYQTHFNTNSASVNALNGLGITNIVLSNDITKSKIDYIVSNSIKPVILFVYGKSQIMYSRRTLISNFNEFYNTNENNPIISESVSKVIFDMKESNMGTVAYNHNYYNGSVLINDNANIRFFLINLVDLTNDEAKEVIDALASEEYDKLGTIKENSDNGFLYTETIYRVRD